MLLNVLRTGDLDPDEFKFECADLCWVKAGSTEAPWPQGHPLHGGFPLAPR